MYLQLCKYQEIAVDRMIEQSLKCYNSNRFKQFVLLHAITGSGKTVMAASYIQRIFLELPRATIIWLSVGKGDLHSQSRDSLVKYLPQHIPVKKFDEVVTQDRLHEKEVLVINWESLNTKKLNKDTGKREFANTAMKDGEGNNLLKVLEKTHQIGNEIILVVDESHTTAGSITSKEIISLINPVFTVELTATPDDSKVSRADKEPQNGFYVGINSEDVINEGMIKKRVLLNDTKAIGGHANVYEYLIQQGMLKHDELTKAYANENVAINPLVCIQLADSQKGDTTKEEIIKILKDKDITVSNGKLAIWLSGQKDNLDDITSPQSQVSYLIFKQAIATGWDCPRAHILIKLRETKSETFDLQTVGRILRMPERKHYATNCLNYGYIYTDSDTYVVNTGDYKAVLPIRQELREEFKNTIMPITFQSQKLVTPKKDNNPYDDILETEFANHMSKVTLDYNFSNLVTTIKQGYIDTLDFDDTFNAHIDVADAGSISIDLTVEDINRQFDSLVNVFKANTFTHPMVRTTIKKHFEAKARALAPSVGKSWYVVFKMIALTNKDLLLNVFTQIKKDNLHRIAKIVESHDFTFTEDRHTNEKNTIDLAKCAYKEHFCSKYKTETVFEEYLEENENVLWWIKNEDSGFSIVYEFEKEQHEFYPDYFVWFKNTNRLGIYEVKDVNDKDKLTSTPAKLKALSEYINNEREDYKPKYDLCGGLVECTQDGVNKSTLPKELQ